MLIATKSSFLQLGLARSLHDTRSPSPLRGLCHWFCSFVKNLSSFRDRGPPGPNHRGIRTAAFLWWRQRRLASKKEAVCATAWLPSVHDSVFRCILYSPSRQSPCPGRARELTVKLFSPVPSVRKKERKQTSPGRDGTVPSVVRGRP